MLTHKHHIKDCFNQAFSTYDHHNAIQTTAGKKLIEMIPATIPDRYFKHIIDLGCGTGIVTEQLVHTFTYHCLYAIDIADQLLLKAKERLKQSKIVIHEADFDTFSFEGTLFDLVFSNMALQWSINLHHTLLHIHKNLHAEGLIAFSLPLSGSLHELKTHAKNKFYTLEEILTTFVQIEFNPIQYTTQTWMPMFNTGIQALQSLKSIGANYVFSRERKCSSMFYLRKEKFLPCQLTYHVGFFVGMKNSRRNL